MAEGTTSSFDPVTGLHNKSTFQYDKVVPPRQGSMSNAQANAIVQALAQVDPAKALVFGMQLKGRMGYERDIAAGMTEKEAMARNGANIFFSNASAALKSMTPKPVDPMDAIQLEIAKARRDEMLRKAAMPPKSNVPQEWVGRDPSKFYIGPGGGVIHPEKSTEQTDTITEKIPEVLVGSPAVAGRPAMKKFGKWTGWDWTAKDDPGQISSPEIRPSPAMTITRKVPRGTTAPLSSVAAPSPLAPPTEAQNVSSRPYKSFDNEADAVKEGYQVGDVIYLRGVGKVRLK